ncbi:ABC transporter ATP-binding protein [Chloroflexus sp.]|uniref:ABC transporter ATP-binding protein n=1 Tax=Chloroflexus sp. TaxID=1904827 RepID=UPI004049AE53
MRMIDKTVICCEHVTKSYLEGERQRIVLRDITFQVQAGELIVLLGKSGSGKSTLLNLVSGIDIPDTGAIWVAGQRLDQLRERERTLFRRRSIGFVFQFYNLAPTLTALENVLLPLELNGQRGETARAAALAMLEAVGLADRANTYPDRLSGGEQQRVAIARALVHNPDLVLADEPTGNLDSDTGAQVLDLLDQLTRQQGKTLIMVTHSREMVGVADRVFQLRNGQIQDVALSAV